MTVVELVTPDGTGVGTMGKLEAHAAPGHLHRAFSVLVFDERGRLLLQRRAAAKYHFAGCWSNACCSHPGPGPDLVEQAVARTRAELGLDVTLERVGTFTYRAVDEGSGLVEHELDTVLVGYVPSSAQLTLDPAEASDTRFLSVEALRAEVAAGPRSFTPWLLAALSCAQRAGHPRP